MTRARWNSNRILWLLLCLPLLAGCKTTEEKKKGKEATSLRFHLEVNPDGSDRSGMVPIFREKPVMVNMSRDPFLHEGDIQEASVVDVDELGGFGIRVVFDRHGTMVLENFTTSYKGLRIGIYARYTEVRWLAAPRITRRITEGVFVFTPDATREEAERIVLGVNNVAKKLRKGQTFK